MMTDADKRVARELIEFGCSARLVGRYLGYAHCTILANLVDRPPQRRYVRFTDAQIARAERLRRRGLCWKSVAREMGIDDERALSKACRYRGRLPVLPNRLGRAR